MHKRFIINVAGIVQGVGFRPYIFRLADRLNLSGYVKNNSDGIRIELEGNQKNLSQFLSILDNQPPPLAQITQIDINEIDHLGDAEFRIVKTDNSEQKNTLISPDISTCADCRKELTDPEDRRYLYPFINCTNCGPRYTIISDIPYDRPKTSMDKFKMCTKCQKEYDDPMDRRFHAQPNACPDCGPALTFISQDKKTYHENTVEKLRAALMEGQIAAIKGVGGFHLAVDAKNDKAVKMLRNRKHRFEKPLALMIKDLQSAKKYATVNQTAKKLLMSLHRPIVLCKKRENSVLSADISTDNDYYGIMFPYSPLHELILNNEELDALVMTSANISEEPICYENQECVERMEQIADCYLLHDRGIYIRCDDSVMQVVRQKSHFIRRSRGYSPRPIILSQKGPSVLAVGGHLKNTICLIKNNYAFLSQHIGDLENLQTLEAFEHTISHLKNIFEIDPSHVIHDMHPEYLSTKWAQTNVTQSIKAVQHHYAHVLSVMAEHNLINNIIGISLDGTGYGEDGAIWGGEVLVCNAHSFKRMAHFEYLPMPGGEKAILEPWRMAVSYLLKYLPNGLERAVSIFKERSQQINIMQQIIEKKINTPETSSCGRLFDAVAAVLGIRDIVAYEGQAAVMLESLASGSKQNVPEIGPFELIKKEGRYIISPNKIFNDIVELKEQGKDISILSRAFHNALVDIFFKIAENIRTKTGINQIALSGGCFQNMLFLEKLTRQMESTNYHVYTNREVPVNDGGISLGQAYWGMNNC